MESLKERKYNELYAELNDKWEKDGTLPKEEALVLWYLTLCGIGGDKEKRDALFPLVDELYYDLYPVLLFPDRTRETWTKAEIKDLVDEKVPILLKASKEGDMFAAECLGLIYYNGLGRKQSDKQMVKWLEIALERGSLIATCLLSDFYLKEGNVMKARNALLIGAAAGYRDAECDLGLMYITQPVELGEKDIPTAIEKGIYLLEKAAEGDHIKASSILAGLYRTGNPLLGVEKEEKKYFQLLKKINTLNPDMGVAELAECYEQGIGTRKNKKKAEELKARLDEHYVVD